MPFRRQNRIHRCSGSLLCLASTLVAAFQHGGIALETVDAVLKPVFARIRTCSPVGSICSGREAQGWASYYAISHVGMCRCMLTGPCLAGHAKICSPWELALHTFDKFGNARVSGGEDVAVDVEGPQGTEIRSASVQDRGNGWYSIVLQPDREGRWLLTPRCFIPVPASRESTSPESNNLRKMCNDHSRGSGLLQHCPAVWQGGPLAAHPRVHASLN